MSSHGLRSLRGLVVLAFVLVGLDCSLALNVDEEPCDADADCANRGQAFAGSVCVEHLCQAAVGSGGQGGGDPRWSCLGQVEWPEPQPGLMIVYEVRIIELMSQQPPEGLEVLVCPPLDVDCTSPTLGPLTVDADGRFTVELESGFTGYFDVTSPTTTPAMLFVGKPLVEEISDPLPIQILTPETFQTLATFGGYTIDSARGHALVLATDCNDQTAAGVTLSTDSEDPEVEGFYLIGQFPDPDATGTDSSGNGGFINIPAGWATISSQRQETDQLIGSTRFTVRAGTISYLTAMPSPIE